MFLGDTSKCETALGCIIKQRAASSKGLSRVCLSAFTLTWPMHRMGRVALQLNARWLCTPVQT